MFVADACADETVSPIMSRRGATSIESTLARLRFIEVTASLKSDLVGAS